MSPYRYASGGPTDPNFANVSLLLHFEGSNGGTTFTDNSPYAHTPPKLVHNTTTSTTQHKYGSTSGFFNGNHYLLYDHATEFELTTGDWTIESWFYPTALSSQGYVILKAAGTGYYPFQLYHDASGHFALRGFSVGTSLVYNIVAASASSTGAWYHLAGTRNGNTFTLWVDGVSAGTATSSAALYTSASDPVVIGQTASYTSSLTGYLDDLRITKGVARYTSTFTPPSAAFPDS